MLAPQRRIDAGVIGDLLAAPHRYEFFQAMRLLEQAGAAERVRFRNMLSDTAARCTVILSTHVIEDISHSCNDLAIINKGGVLFRGAPSELIGAARGKVWTILTQGERPNGGLSVVSTLQLQNGVQYRVIGTPGEQYAATPVEPSLEDGYIWMMNHPESSKQGELQPTP